MHGWKQPQEAISGIPLLQAGQHATSWDQLVFILFILESFEEGSCKLFFTELMDSPLSFRSLGWVKSSWIGQSSEQSFSECFSPWCLPCYTLANPTLNLQCNHLDFVTARLTWVSLLPVQIPLCTSLIRSVVILTRAIIFSSPKVGECLKGESTDVWDIRQKKMDTIQKSLLRRGQSLAWSMRPEDLSFVRNTLIFLYSCIS